MSHLPQPTTQKCSLLGLVQFLTRYSYAVRRAWHICPLSSVRLSVTDVLWLNGARYSQGCYW